MNKLVESGCLQEIACGNNFAYDLEDSNLFLSTEYKVLQNQGEGNFVTCVKMLHNGKVQLYYWIKEQKPFAMMLPSMDAEKFVTIVANLFANVISVKNNGFLSCQNIEISYDKIYVDPATCKVSLVYLPLKEKLHDDYAAFENELRTGLIKIINGISTLYSPKIKKLSDALADGTLSLEEVCGRIKESGSGAIRKKTPKQEKKVRLVSLNTPMSVELYVTKDEFVIGKKAGMVDGVVSISNMVSRVHCKINKMNGKYTVTDLKSANGTYVNDVRITVGQPYFMKNGDILRLANVSFRVDIG